MLGFGAASKGTTLHVRAHVAGLELLLTGGYTDWFDTEYDVRFSALQFTGAHAWARMDMHTYAVLHACMWT